MEPVSIQSFHRVVPMIYVYTTPGVAYHDGWLKIGYTEKQTVEERIAEQTHTADVRWKLAWKNNAMYTDGSGEYFTDHDFHHYLTARRQVERTPNTEWFHLDIPHSKEYFYSFASREVPVTETGDSYSLREEQQRAVQMTKEYFENGGTEFLWNAKPRFGKTLTCYELIWQMGLTKVLIVTNRPSIANSWSEDFNKFIGWRGELCFVSDTDALSGKQGVMSRDEYNSIMLHLSEEDRKGMVAFESLQGLKGSVYFGGQYDKLRWMAKEYYADGKKRHGMDFDLLIIDEAQEGIEAAAVKLLEKEPAKAKALLTNYTKMTAQSAFDTWKRLGEFLVVKYNDGVVRRMKDGKFERNAIGQPAGVVRPGYPKEFLEEYVKQTGDRYKMPE